MFFTFINNISLLFQKINKNKKSKFIKVFWAIALLPFLICYSLCQAFALLFLNSFHSFNLTASQRKNGVYYTSYRQHLKFKSHARIFSLSSIATVIVSVLAVNIITTAFFNYHGAKPVYADAIISCTGSSSAPYSVPNEGALTGVVIFSDGGGDGWCELDAPITAASVLIETGVTLTHTATDVDGINITTTGNFTVEAGAYINADAKGCQSINSWPFDGYGPTVTNVCVQGAAAGNTGGWGDGDTQWGDWTGDQGAGHGGAGGLGTNVALNAGGALYDDATAPVLFGSSGGGNHAVSLGGAGGGLIRLVVSGELIANGVISTNGGAGISAGDRAAGGGSGGSIYITTNILSGSTGTFAATGGAGGDDAMPYGGGGGGGRIAIKYISSTFTHEGVGPFDSADFFVSGGSTTSPATAGGKGTVYVEDTDDSAVVIYQGFDYSTDYSKTTWYIDPGATSQNCNVASDTSPSITATNLTLGGTITCNNATLSSFNFTATNLTLGGTITSSSASTVNFSAASSFVLQNGATISVSKVGSTVDFNIPAGNNQTWSGLTLTGGAQGFFTIDDAVGITLTGNSTIAANTRWTNLTSLQIDSGSSINANAKGCQGAADDGFGPTDPGNVCIVNTAGWGDGLSGSGSWGYGTGNQGAGYGGIGGLGNNASLNAGGHTYGSSTTPTLFGSSGGGNHAVSLGGAGGGLIRLVVSGEFIANGAISANGGAGMIAGDRAAGGGSGGSIYITTNILSGSTGTFAATGGAGANSTNPYGGGGGGGRIAFEYGMDSTNFLPTAFTDLTAATVAAYGAKGGGTAEDGAVGTLSMVQSVSLTSISITDNSGYTNDATPTIAVSQSGAGPTDIAFSCDAGSNWSAWILYPGDIINSGVATDFNITNGATGCSATNELKTIYAKIKNAGGESAIVSDTTTYDTLAPTVSNVTATNANGTYGAGTVITATVQFNNSMVVTGTPQIRLDMNGTDREANYASVVTDTLSFTYTIVNGDNKNDLDYTGSGALTLNSGTIKDLAGNSATLALPAPGTSNSLGANKNINIVTNPNVNWSAGSQSRAESIGTMTLTATLSFAYISDVTIPYTLSGTATGSGTDYSITASPLVIAAGQTSGSVTITVINDHIDEADETVIITMGDLINGVKGATDVHTATITDDDIPGITVTQSGGITNVSEGGITDTYALVLDSKPAADVVITLNHNTQINISSAAVTFTPVNWATPQTITVSGQRDANNSEGTVVSTLTHTAVSTDPGYQAISISAVAVNVADNQLPIANAGPDQTINETESATLNSAASTDADGDTLTTTWAEVSDSSDGCSQTGTTVVTLNKESNYACVFSLIANDGYGDSAMDTMTINIIAHNDPPVINSIADVTINEKDTLVITVSSSDKDSSSLTLGAINNPTGSVFSDNRNKTGNLTWVPTYDQAGNYHITFSASDGTNQTTETVAVNVNNVVTNQVPTFSNSLPNLAFYAGTSITPFDLDDYFTDANGDTLTYTSTGNENINVEFTDGRVTLSANDDYFGTEAVYFIATDPTGETATSNPIIISVSEFTEDNIGYLSGASKGQGMITVYDKNNNVVANWQAFPIGGVVPKLGTINNQTYIFAVKSRTGTTMHVYTATGQLITKKKLSTKCNWRRLAVGNLNNDKSNEEIAIVTRRGKTLFLKIYSFNPDTRHFTLLKRSAYQYLQKNYRVNIENKNILVIINGEGKIVYRWQPFK